MSKPQTSYNHMLHPDCVFCDAPGMILVSYAPHLRRLIDYAQESLRADNCDKEAVYQTIFPRIEALVQHLRHHTGALHALTVYSRSAFPEAWFFYESFEALRSAFVADTIVYAVHDAPHLPLPVTIENAAAHRVALDMESVRHANLVKGKQARGVLGGVWGRRVNQDYDPDIGLLPIDIDQGDLQDRDAVIERLTSKNLPFVICPSFSATEHRAKCHVFLHDDARIPLSHLTTNYAEVVRLVLGNRLSTLADPAQGRPRQLTFVTAVARRLGDPRFAIRSQPESASWTNLLRSMSAPTGARHGPVPPSRSHDPAGEPRKRSREAELIATAWPEPVCPAIIATCDRNSLSLIACTRCAYDHRMTDAEKLHYLKGLADNIHRAEPRSSHNFDWLVRQFRRNQQEIVTMFLRNL